MNNLYPEAVHPSGPAEGMNTRGIFGEYSREHSGDTPAIDASSTGPSEVSFLMYQFAGLSVTLLSYPPRLCSADQSTISHRKLHRYLHHSERVELACAHLVADSVKAI